MKLVRSSAAPFFQANPIAMLQIVTAVSFVLMPRPAIAIDTSGLMGNPAFDQQCITDTAQLLASDLELARLTALFGSFFDDIDPTVDGASGNSDEPFCAIDADTNKLSCNLDFSQIETALDLGNRCIENDDAQLLLFSYDTDELYSFCVLCTYNYLAT